MSSFSDAFTAGAGFTPDALNHFIRVFRRHGDCGQDFD